MDSLPPPNGTRKHPLSRRRFTAGTAVTATLLTDAVAREVEQALFPAQSIQTVWKRETRPLPKD